MNTDGNSWAEVNGKLFKRFEFSNFLEAWDFVNQVGELAEKSMHHPDINFGWGYAEITLFTHDENKISDKDWKLAKEISNII